MTSSAKTSAGLTVKATLGEGDHGRTMLLTVFLACYIFRLTPSIYCSTTMLTKIHGHGCVCFYIIARVE